MILGSAKPKACMIWSLCRRGCKKSPADCAQASNRTSKGVSHAKEDQLTFAEAVQAFRDNQPARALLLDGSRTNKMFQDFLDVGLVRALQQIGISGTG